MAKEYTVKKNFTFGYVVYKTGDVVTEKEAMDTGLDKWYEKTKGKTWAGQVITQSKSEGEVIKDKMEEPFKDLVDTSLNTEVFDEVLLKRITSKGKTLVDVRGMTWKEMSKTFGIGVASKIRKALKEYDKSK